MEFSAAGLDLLKRSEGFRAKTYLDACGFPTIGFGHRLLNPASFPNGIDEPEAEDILTADVNFACQSVARLVKVPLTQGQFDALVDFTFNLGAARLSGSTLLKTLNAGKYDQAAEQILLWDHGVIDGHEAELPGLKARRAAEFAMWHSEAQEAGPSTPLSEQKAGPSTPLSEQKAGPFDSLRSLRMTGSVDQLKADS